MLIRRPASPSQKSGCAFAFISRNFFFHRTRFGGARFRKFRQHDLAAIVDEIGREPAIRGTAPYILLYIGMEHAYTIGPFCAFGGAYPRCIDIQPPTSPPKHILGYRAAIQGLPGQDDRLMSGLEAEPQPAHCLAAEVAGAVISYSSGLSHLE